MADPQQGQDGMFTPSMNPAQHWQEFSDENSGRTYYANLMTRETTWTRPACLDDVPVQTQAVETTENVDTGAASNWEVYFDDATGRNYWYNTETCETTWEDPNENQAETAGYNFSVTMDQNEDFNDDGFGGIPDLPTSPDASKTTMSFDAAMTSHQGEADEDQVAVADVGGKWRKVFDDNSGRDYWYHEDTHETTWTMPPEWQNKLLLGTDIQDQMAKVRANSLMEAMHYDDDDDFDLPPLPVQQDMRYEEEDSSEASDFSDEEGGGREVTGNVSEVIQHNAMPDYMEEDGFETGRDMNMGGPPPNPVKSVQIVDHHVGRSQGDPPGRSQGDPVNRNYKSHVVLQDFGDSDDDSDFGAHENIQVERYSEHPKSTEWFEFAMRNHAEFPMIQYAGEHFRPEQSGMFGNRTHAEDLRHSTTKLSKSLLNLTSALNSEAAEAFRSILAFMGDRRAKKDPDEYAKKLLSLALGATQQIQDEIYCQLIKQTTNNTNAESNLKGWKLIALTCGVFGPSQTLVRYLASYLYIHTTQLNEIARWAKYALERLDVCWQCGRRNWFPTSDEIAAVNQRKPATVKVFYLDGTYKTILVDSQTRVDEAQAALGAALNLSYPEFYGLYEMETMDQGHVQRYFGKMRHDQLKRDDKVKALTELPIDRHLEKDERLCDVMASWEYGTFKDRDFQLVFKVRLISREKVGALSKEGLLLHFIQAAYNVSHGFYPVSEKLAWELAALQCQGVFGTHEKDFWTNGLIFSKLHHYLPYTMFDTQDKAASEVKILTMHYNYEEYDKQDAHRMYIEQIIEIESLEQIYGSHFFPCVRLSRLKADDGSDMNDLMLVGVCETGLSLMDPFTREITTFYPLTEILTYGFRQDAFLFVAGTIRKQKKWRLATYCGKAMNDLLMSYIQLKVQQSEIAANIASMSIGMD